MSKQTETKLRKTIKRLRKALREIRNQQLSPANEPEIAADSILRLSHKITAKIADDALKGK